MNRYALATMLAHVIVNGRVIISGGRIRIAHYVQPARPAVTCS